MKIIDLLNKIAKGEEVPKRIKLDNYEFQYNKTYEQYYNKYATNLLEHISDYNYSGLNDEVEIIEEEKKIEKISLNIEGDIIYCENGETHRFNTNKQNRYLANKINELIDVINDMRDKEC